MFTRETAKYHGLSEGDEEANGLLSSETQGVDGERTGSSKYTLSWGCYALYTVFAISLLLNLVSLWDVDRKSKDIRIPSPLFCESSISA